MTTIRTFENLPLFADDTALGIALLGDRKSREWPQIAALLEGRGLPRIDPIMGGRYIPAIKAFFDREYGIGGTPPTAPDGVEDLGAWKRKRQAKV